MAIPSLILIFIMSLLSLDDSGISSDDATSPSDDSISTISSSQALVMTESYSGDLFAADDGGDVARDGDDSDEDEDLDDELIQWSVRKKLKKQRLCKLGKRTVAKVPYTQLRRGCCIYGKHSLGIRFRC